MTRALRREALHRDSNTHRGLLYVLSLCEVTATKKPVRAALRRVSIITCKKRKRAFLKPKHKEARLAFARAHIDSTPEQWATVLFTDES